MNNQNLTWVHYLPISTFVLLTLIFFISSYLFAQTFFNLKKMFVFKQQGVDYWQNHKMLRIFKISSGLMFGFYWINVALFIVYISSLHNENEKFIWILYYTLEGLNLSFLVGASGYLLWISKTSNSFIIVVKNQKMVLLSNIIPITAIRKITHDAKRKYFLIYWNDQEIIGNIQQAKVCYHYQLKDFLRKLEIPVEFD